MQVRKALKKVLAFGAGLTMVGATMMGAMAASYTLADYPAPFVKDGKFDGLIVIGDQAKSSDVVGAIDVANSLQYSMQQKSTVNVGGTSSTTISDGFKIETQGQKLYYGDALSERRTTVTGTDLNMLADLKVSHDEEGSEYTYRQSIVLGGAYPTYGTPPSSSDIDPVAYLDWQDQTYAMVIEFPKAIEMGNMTDEAMTIFGQEVVVSGNSGELSATKLTLYGGGVDTTIAAGESTTIQTGDSTINVEVIGINTATADSKATVKVNGESKEVLAQKTYTIGGERIYIKDIFAYTTPVTSGAVRMFVGSDKIVLEDGQDVTKGKGDVVVDEATVSFTSGGTNKVSKITINVTPSGMDEDVKYQVAGDSFTDPVFGGFKFVFSGMNPAIGSAERDVIKLYPSGNQYMNLMFTNRDGYTFDERMFYGSGTTDVLLAYDSDTKFVIDNNAVGNGGYGCNAYLNEDNDDFFIIDDGQGHSHVLQMLSITASASEKKIRVKDVAAGTTTDHSFSDDATYGYKGSMYYNGKEYVFYVWDGSTDLPGGVTIFNSTSCPTIFDGSTTYAEKIMYVNNGLIMDNAVQGFYTKGGALITPLPANGAALNTTATWLWNRTVLTEETAWNEEESPDDNTYLNMTISYLSTYSGSGKRIKVGNTIPGVTTETWDSNGDKQSGLTPYGTYVVVDTENDDAYIEYPTVQAFFDVFVAPLAATTSSVGAGGNVETVTLDRIQVGAAKLASEVSDLTAQNIIVVGGPCVNTAAAYLMGDPADCTAGFEPGKAMIKLYENGNKVALLVAGYSAVDTRRATSVLADYTKYTLTGMEVEVKQGTGSTTMVTAVTEQE